MSERVIPRYGLEAGHNKETGWFVCGFGLFTSPTREGVERSFRPYSDLEELIAAARDACVDHDGSERDLCALCRLLVTLRRWDGES